MKFSTKARVVLALSSLLLLLVAVPLIGSRLGPAEPKEVELSVAVDHIRDGHVQEATVDDKTNTVTLTLNDGVAGPGKVAAEYPYAYSDTLTETLLAENVTTEAEAPQPPNPIVRLLTALLPIVLIAGLLVWLVKSGSMTGGVGKWGKGRGEEMGGVPTTRFDDVAGCDEAKGDMMELVEFLKSPERFTAVGAKAPRGALLVGPPGTGKTLLARAVAGEAGVPFFPVSGSDFVETFVGVGAKRARELFDKARAAGSAIIFIDEIDAIGGKRSGGGSPSNGGDSERERTLVQMLTEMDGFDTDHQIIVLAATNRPDTLDPALTRPGRLDRMIQVPAPDRKGRTDILAVHTQGKPVREDVDLVALARRTPGMSGAELAQLVNEACMVAARQGLAEVDSDCFDSALATVALGRARTSALVTDFDRKVTAWHEAGHTLAALLLPAADDPVSVSIVPRGPAGGVTWMSGSDDMYLTRGKALASLRVSLAGRVGEEILLDGEFTQGAHGDLQAATRQAMSMITEYGMTNAGYAVVAADAVTMGGQVSSGVLRKVNELLEDAHTDAAALLRENQVLLTRIAEELLEHETLSLVDLQRLVAEVEGAPQPA